MRAALRSLWSDRFYSGINIAGLSVGLAACILILLFVREELGFDGFYRDAGRIYRIEMTMTPPGRTPQTSIASAGRSKEGFVTQIPEVEAAARIYFQPAAVRRGDSRFNENVAYIDPEFFSLFDLPMASGQRDAIFTDNHAILISRDMARKYFGDGEAIGQTLTFDDAESFHVVGVLENLPRRTHLKVDFLAWFDTARFAADPRIAESWTWLFVHTYIKLRAGADIEAVRARLPEFTDRNVVLDFRGMEKFKASSIMHYGLVPLTDIHLHSASNANFRAAGNALTVYASIAIALLILAVVIINFMNLSTARSALRAREVSLRKVLGARRSDLIVQFLGEAVVTAGAALLLGAMLVEVSLPWYNRLIDKNLGFDLGQDYGFMLAIGGLTILVGLIAGLYPALYLSSFRPAKILKANEKSTGGGSARLRASLVFVQFSISIALLAATAIIFSQTRFARERALGYNRDNMLVISGTRLAGNQAGARTLKDEILRIPGVLGASQTAYVPTSPQEDNFPVFLPDTADPVVVTTLSVDHDFFDTYSVSPLAGRVFAEDRARDKLVIPADQAIPLAVNVIINESAVRRLGLGTVDEAIGRHFSILVAQQRSAQATVIGVIPDMHFRSLHIAVRPKVLLSRADRFNFLTVHYRTGNVAALLGAIDATWKGLHPEVPIRRTFLDAAIASQYGAERKATSLIIAFAFLAIAVACLGLFGLAAFSAQRRTREIGIRKVLGARARDIVGLLVWQFSRPVLLANIIAWPIAWVVMDGWLAGFVYRIDLSPWFFLGAGGLALLIAWATVSWHAWWVARANPVHALRCE